MCVLKVSSEVDPVDILSREWSVTVAKQSLLKCSGIYNYTYMCVCVCVRVLGVTSPPTLSPCLLQLTTQE